MRLTVLTVCLLAAPLASAEVPRATEFQWMSGCWGYESGGSRYEEHWLTPSGNSMLGVARRDADGFTRDFDYFRIVTTGGGFDFISQPRGDVEQRYGMTAKTANSVSFERLGGSGFPNKISYEYSAPDSLKARLEGRSEDGKPLSTQFPMRRQSCTSN